MNENISVNKKAKASLSKQDLEVLKLLEKTNKQYDQYLKIISIDLFKFLTDNDTIDIIKHDWDNPLTLVIQE